MASQQLTSRCSGRFGKRVFSICERNSSSANWKSLPASRAQVARLKQLYDARSMHMPSGITRGEASPTYHSGDGPRCRGLAPPAIRPSAKATTVRGKLRSTANRVWPRTYNLDGLAHFEGLEFHDALPEFLSAEIVDGHSGVNLNLPIWTDSDERLVKPFALG